MLSKANSLLALGLLLSNPVFSQGSVNGLYTLFTTPQERQLIDANRYKTTEKPVEVEQQPSETVSKVEEVTPQPTEKVILDVSLGGFTVTRNGQNIAWVNNKPYEHGGKLDDGSTVYITGDNTPRVQIKTPDGKYHSLLAGEVQQLEYLKPLNEG